MPLHLSALADLEWLLRTGSEPAAQDRERERAIAKRVVVERGVDPAAARRHVDEDPGFRRALALAWLQAVAEHRTDLPGAWIGRGLAVVGWILLLSGFVLGVGSAKTLLAYDGSVPVNVLQFIAFFFLLQIAFLVVMLVFVLRSRSPGSTPGLLHRPIAWLAQRFGGKGHDLTEVLRTLHARHGLYADAERWTLFSLAQRFGVAFNAGAVLASLHTIFFSDLVFAWSTTLALEAGTVHAVMDALALPWSWYPAATVDLEVVTVSQWARMPGAFVGDITTEGALELTSEWWGFLVAGLLVYGLIPRVLAWTIGRTLAARALRRASFDHAGYQELFDRMLPRGSGWLGPDPVAVVGPAPTTGRSPATPRAPELPGARTVAVAWGSIARNHAELTALVQRRFAVPVREMITAGTAALTTDDDAIQRTRGQRAARVVFFVAVGHQPTADVLGFLRRLRAAIGATVPIVVGLVDFAADGRCLDAEADERSAWKRSLGALDDPYLWVEAMGAPQ